MKLKSTLSVFALFLFLSFISNAQPPDYPFPHPKGYVCFKTDQPMVVDGLLDEDSWEKAEWTDTFLDITGDKGMPPYLDTKVKMLWDNHYFYIAAELEEPHLWGTITERDMIIFKDNDFEIFIDTDADNHHIYEMQINVLNTVWDLLVTKPYRDNGMAIDNFNFMGLKTAVAPFGTIDDPIDMDEKWSLEIAIPWQNFEDWNPKLESRIPRDGEQWRINFARVQWELESNRYSYAKKVDYRRKPIPYHNWVWSPQGVHEIHQPETWGYVQFSHKKVGTANASFKQDLDFNLKMALMDVYFQQKRYFKKHGKYTANIDDLQISEYNKIRFGEKFRIETMHKKFIVMAEGYYGHWQVDECSKFSLRPIKLE